VTRDRDNWLAIIKSVERECSMLQLAAERLIIQSSRDPTILPKRRTASKDLRDAFENLEGTYLIRLFAEFETGLRLYWITIKRTHPRTKDLINGSAASRRASPELVTAIHAIREYRNLLVHQRRVAISPVGLATARSACCQFLSRLPESWT